MRLKVTLPAASIVESTVIVPTMARPSYSLMTSPTLVPAPRPTSRSMAERFVTLSVPLAPVSLAATRSTPVGTLSVVKFQSPACERPA